MDKTLEEKTKTNVIFVDPELLKVPMKKDHDKNVENVEKTKNENEVLTKDSVKTERNNWVRSEKFVFVKP